MSLGILVKLLAEKTVTEMIYTVSSGAYS